MGISPELRRWTWIVAPLFIFLAACEGDTVEPTALSPVGSSAARISLESSSLTPKEALGKAIFFDKDLSLRGNQACAACHAPEYGFTGPIPGVNRGGSIYMGSLRFRSGNRNERIRRSVGGRLGRGAEPRFPCRGPQGLPFGGAHRL